MADEDIDIEGSEEEEQKKSKAIWIILVVVILLGGGGGAWLILNPLSETEDISGQAESQIEGGQVSPYGQIFSLDNFVVNLSDPGGKRYLKTRIELEFTHPDYQEELKARMPQLRDTILMVLSSKTLEDIQGVDGKIALRNQLIMRINQILTHAKIRNLYFTEFVVQ